MAKLTKRQRLKRDPINQRRGKVRAWAKKWGAIVSSYFYLPERKELVHSKHLMLDGFLPGRFHPNPRVNRRRQFV